MIQQRHKYDCCVACMAMYTGRTYEQIREQFYKNQDFDRQGIELTDLIWVLEMLGCKPVEHFGLKPDVPGIVLVKSKNYIYGWHAIYWDGKRVQDPQTGRSAYRCYRELPPEDLVLYTIHEDEVAVAEPPKKRQRQVLIEGESNENDISDSSTGAELSSD